MTVRIALSAGWVGSGRTQPADTVQGRPAKCVGCSRWGSGSDSDSH